MIHVSFFSILKWFKVQAVSVLCMLCWRKDWSSCVFWFHQPVCHVLLHVSHLLRTARAAICFLTLFRFLVVLFVFIRCGIYILIAHHILSPTDILACHLGFLCQLPTQAVALIGQKPCHGDLWEKTYTTNNKKESNLSMYLSLISEDTKQNTVYRHTVRWHNGHLRESILFHWTPLTFMCPIWLIH